MPRGEDSTDESQSELHRLCNWSRIGLDSSIALKSELLEYSARRCSSSVQVLGLSQKEADHDFSTASAGAYVAMIDMDRTTQESPS